MNPEQKNSVLASINGWAPRVIDEYIDIERNNRGEISTELTEEKKGIAKELAETLLNISNHGTSEIAQDFINRLEEDEELRFILNLMNSPRNVRPTDPSLKGHENEIRMLIKHRFIAFANQIVTEYAIEKTSLQLQTVVPSAPAADISDLYPPSAPPLWALEQKLLQENMQYVINFDASLHASMELFNSRKTNIDYIKDSAKIASLGLFYLGFGSLYLACQCGDFTPGVIILGLLGLALLTLGVIVTSGTYLIVAAAFSLTYGLTKLKDSVEKMLTVVDRPTNALRGLARIGMTAGLTYGAIKGGMIVGAVLGSLVFPGLGTAIGAAIGATVGGVFGLGLASYISKHMVRCVSAVVNFNTINPTNPNRYKLTSIQSRRLRKMGADLNEINNLLLELRDMKHKTPFLASIKSNDSGRQFKKKVNDMIENVKNGLVNKEQVFVNGKVFQLFQNRSSLEYTAQNRNIGYALAMPEPSAPPLEDEDYDRRNQNNTVKRLEYVWA